MKRLVSALAILIFSVVTVFATDAAPADSKKDCIKKCNEAQAACKDLAKAEKQKNKKCNEEAVKCKKECEKIKEDKAKKEKKEKEPKEKKDKKAI